MMLHRALFQPTTARIGSTDEWKTKMGLVQPVRRCAPTTVPKPRAQRPLSSARDPQDIAFFERQIGKALAERQDAYAKHWLQRLFDYRAVAPANGLSVPLTKPTSIASCQRMIGYCVSRGEDANARWWLSQLRNYR
jgi:hypothetical protein